MISSLFGEWIAMTKVPAGAGWDPGPQGDGGIRGVPAFFTGAELLERLLRMIALATPGVSP